VLDGSAHEGPFDVAPEHLVHELACRSGTERQVHVAVGCDEGRHGVWQPEGRGRRQGSDYEPAPGSPVIKHSLRGIPPKAFQGVRERYQPDTRWREDHAVMGAIEQGGTEVGFQASHVMRENAREQMDRLMMPMTSLWRWSRN
jgi:hypothetical protein